MDNLIQVIYPLDLAPSRRITPFRLLLWTDRLMLSVVQCM
jgi:hypothetical protein